MFEGLYTNISQKYPKRRELFNVDLTFDDFLDERKAFDEKEIRLVFIRQLKRLLKEDRALLLIEKISLLDGMLKKLREKFKEERIPDLNDFYKELSPILMQKYWEMSLNPPDREDLDDLFLHSLHIAIEEEVYLWQEKTSHKLL